MIYLLLPLFVLTGIFVLTRTIEFDKLFRRIAEDKSHWPVFDSSGIEVGNIRDGDLAVIQLENIKKPSLYCSQLAVTFNMLLNFGWHQLMVIPAIFTFVFICAFAIAPDNVYILLRLLTEQNPEAMTSVRTMFLGGTAIFFLTQLTMLSSPSVRQAHGWRNVFDEAANEAVRAKLRIATGVGPISYEYSVLDYAKHVNCATTSTLSDQG